MQQPDFYLTHSQMRLLECLAREGTEAEKYVGIERFTQALAHYLTKDYKDDIDRKDGFALGIRLMPLPPITLLPKTEATV